LFRPTEAKSEKAVLSLEPDPACGSLSKANRIYRFEATANMNLFPRVGNQGIGDTGGRVRKGAGGNLPCGENRLQRVPNFQ
jgi:hypothetical protein